MANKEKRFETIYTQGTSLSIVVDTETGVNYLVHDTGITPLLDKNGTVVITEINKQTLYWLQGISILIMNKGGTYGKNLCIVGNRP